MNIIIITKSVYLKIGSHKIWGSTVLVKENSILKNRIDKLNSKQEYNEKVAKIHEEINAGHKIEEESMKIAVENR